MTFFEENILAIYGKAGEEWLKNLPHLITSLSQFWGLKDLNPVPDLSYNYVMAGNRDTIPVILKVGMDRKSLANEATALKIFQHHGGIQLFETELSVGALLLEQAIPGQSLKSFFPKKDIESIKIVADIIRNLHKAPVPEASSFATLKGWLPVLDKAWAIPDVFLVKARRLKEKLLNLPTQPVLLHGDLHHNNILRHGEGWAVIDPKGIIGHPLFEITTFLYNPIPDFLTIPDLKECLQQRLHLFANEFHVEETLLAEWAFVKAVLSLCWTLEDNLDPGNYLEYINILQSLYP